MTKHGQRQHRITEWYLRSFARMTKSGAELAVYDLHTGAFDWHVVSTFMAPINDHSKEIEKDLERIETPAARAASHLLSAAAHLGPGFYALADESSPAALEEFRDGGVLEGVSLMVAARNLPARRRPTRSRWRSSSHSCTHGRPSSETPIPPGRGRGYAWRPR